MARLRPIDEHDLRWWCHEAPAIFGLRCGLGPALERARAGQLFDRGSHGNSDSDRVVGALRRAERIRRRLRALTPVDREALFAAYCWERMTHLGPLDRLGPVCLLTTSAANAYERSQAKALVKSRGDRTDGLLEKPLPRHITLSNWLAPAMSGNADLRKAVLEQADELLTQACQAWYLYTGDNTQGPGRVRAGVSRSLPGELVDPGRRARHGDRSASTGAVIA